MILMISLEQIMSFLMVYKDFGRFIILLSVCIKHMQEFMVFMVVWIFFFTLFYQVAGVDFDNQDYSELSPFFVNLIQTYRNSIGDIAPP